MRLLRTSARLFHGAPKIHFDLKGSEQTGEYLLDDVHLNLPQPFATRGGRWLQNHPEDIVELEVFLKLIRQATGSLFDIGAQIGTFAVLFCKYSKYNAVAFEPTSPAAEMIRQLAQLNDVAPDRITAIKAAAAADAAQTREMHIDERTGFAQFQKYDSLVSAASTVSVTASTIDHVRSTLHDKVSILKIDVEGFEDEVLQGARQTLAEDRPVILLELHVRYLAERGVSAVKLLNALVKQGYELLRLNGRPFKVARTPMLFLPRAHIIAVPKEEELSYRSLLIQQPLFCRVEG